MKLTVKVQRQIIERSISGVVVESRTIERSISGVVVESRTIERSISVDKSAEDATPLPSSSGYAQP